MCRAENGQDDARRSCRKFAPAGQPLILATLRHGSFPMGNLDCHVVANWVHLALFVHEFIIIVAAENQSMSKNNLGLIEEFWSRLPY